MQPSPTTAPEPLSFAIHGMHCAGCAASVEQTLRSVAGVNAAHVNFATECATVWPDQDRPKLADELTAAVAKAGFQATPTTPEGAFPDAADRATRLRSESRRLLLAAVLGLPVLLWHMLLMPLGLAPAWAETHTGWLVISAMQTCVAALVILTAAGETAAGAIRGLLRRTANMDLLVTLGAAASLASGVGGIASGSHALVGMLDASIMIVLFVGLGKHLEARARGRASYALRALLTRIPPTAVRLVEGRNEVVPIGQVRPGDRLRIAPDAPIPTDGTVVAGQAAVDEALLTGESMPIERRPGDSVAGGTRVVAGSLEILATTTGRDSAAARIGRLVEQAQATKPPWQRFADRAAGVFVPVVLGLSLATFVGWLVIGGADLRWAIERAIAVLVVACPCALGLAIPTAVMVGTARAAERGVLVRDASALEAAGQVRDIVLDKTGTLTLGRPTVARCFLAAKGAPDETTLLLLAASAAQFSEHPLARAIVAAATKRGLDLLEPRNERSRHGGGVSAKIRHADADHAVVVGSADWLRESGIDPGALLESADAAAALGLSVVLIGIDMQPAGIIALADQTHPESKSAIEQLHALGVRVHILSGDRHAAVSRLAGELCISNFESQLSPAEKLERIRTFVSAGRGVAMVGDGLNDAPALAAADVGIAIGTGADVAREAAAICLVGHSPRLVPEAIRISRASARIMHQNIGWAVGYNFVMLPIAILTPLPPALASAAMMLSSISVVLNALRLRRSG